MKNKTVYLQRKIIAMLVVCFSLSAFSIHSIDLLYSPVNPAQLTEHAVPGSQHISTRVELGGGVSFMGFVRMTKEMFAERNEDSITFVLPIMLEARFWPFRNFGVGLQLDQLTGVARGGLLYDTWLLPELMFRSRPDSTGFSLSLVPTSLKVIAHSNDGKETEYVYGFLIGGRSSQTGPLVNWLIWTRIRSAWTWTVCDSQYLRVTASLGAGDSPLDISLTTGWIW